MTDEEKKTLEELATTAESLNEKDKAYLLGVADGLAMKENAEN